MTEEKKLTGYPSIDKPWLKYYSEEAINAPLPECTIYEYLKENNRDFPEDIAILYLGRKIKYGELFHQIDRTAAAFAALGVKPGEIVTVALPSIPEALYVVYALNKIGAVFNMIHPLAGEKEILHYLNEVQSEVAVLFEGTYNIIKDSIGQTKVKHAIVVSAGESLPFGVKQLYFLKTPRARLPKPSVFHSWKDFLAAGANTVAPSVQKDPHAMALISHTGGTTGEPKGVMCSDYNINALIWQVGKTLPSSRQERMLVVLPPFINYSLVNGMFEPLSLGHEVILLPEYKPELFAEYINKYRPNHINSIPAFLEALLKEPRANNLDCSCFKYVYYGGEAMPEETEHELNRFIMSKGAKHHLGKGLGATEMVSSMSLTVNSCNLPGSAGIPFVRCNCKIVDPETKKEECYGEIGEICFSGPTMMLGYYNNLKATDDILKRHADGQLWLHTGDIGFINENGVIYVTGRIKRILITKGKDSITTKLFPDRVEKVIYQHSDVSLCCVVGVPDETRINYPKAFVVLKGEAWNKDHITEEILKICREELPDYMVPDEIEYCSDLPRTPRGKIDYRTLEKMAKEM